MYIESSGQIWVAQKFRPVGDGVDRWMPRACESSTAIRFKEIHSLNCSRRHSHPDAEFHDDTVQRNSHFELQSETFTVRCTVPRRYGLKEFTVLIAVGDIYSSAKRGRHDDTELHISNQPDTFLVQNEQEIHSCYCIRTAEEISGQPGTIRGRKLVYDTDHLKVSRSWDHVITTSSTR